MTSSLRKLLILAYHFPPSSAVAGKVTARLVRHLPSFGYEPIVIAAEPVYWDPGDSVAYADVAAAANVLRLRTLVHPYFWPSRLKEAIRKPAAESKTTANSAAEPASTKKRRLHAFREVIRDFVCYPDKQTNWVLPAFRQAVRLVRGCKIDAMLSVSPPTSAHLAGLLLASLYPGIPWLAQIHDPLAENRYDARLLPILSRADVRLEKTIVERASAVLPATEESTDALITRYPGVDRGRFMTLHNGFDPADFRTVHQAQAHGDILTLTYAGSLYGSRDPFPFLKALAHNLQRGDMDRSKVRVRFAGDCDWYLVPPLRDQVRSLNLEDVVSITGQVPYPDALNMLAESDAVLLFAERQPLQIPAKVYEYLYLQRFVLAFATGATARFVNENHLGAAVAPGDVAGIETALRQLYQRKQRGELAPHVNGHSTPSRFEARQVAKGLAETLDSLTEAAPSRRETKRESYRGLLPNVAKLLGTGCRGPGRDL